jgi:hypothetical protein
MIVIKSQQIVKEAKNQDFPYITFFQYHTRSARKVKKGIIGVNFDYGKNQAEIAWSLCNTKDNFDRSRGLDIVNKRLANNQNCLSHSTNIPGFTINVPTNFPHSMRESLNSTIKRCEKIASANLKKKATASTVTRWVHSPRPNKKVNKTVKSLALVKEVKKIPAKKKLSRV